jgi:hypothetical protein
MINIRYHIITLFAVFLALAVGIVAGSTVIQQSLVDQLEGNLDTLERQIDDVEQRNSELNDAVDRLQGREQVLAEQGPSQLLQNRLSGTTVLLVGVDGIDENAVSSLIDTLTTAGAMVAGEVWLAERLALADDGAVSDLAALLGVSTQNPAGLQAELVQRLGDQLAVVAAPADVDGNDDSPTTQPPVSDDTAAVVAARLLNLLADLQDGRFVDLDGGLEDLSPVDVVGMRLVVAGGAGAELEDDAILLPLLERLGQDSAPISVAVEASRDEPEAPRGEFVGAVRNDRRLRDQLSTVDDIEAFAGRAAVVLALDDLRRARVGHYGVGPGAERLLPAPPSS